MKDSRIKKYQKTIEKLATENKELKCRLKIYSENGLMKLIDETLKMKKEYEDLISLNLEIKSEYEKCLSEQKKLTKEYSVTISRLLKGIS